VSVALSGRLDGAAAAGEDRRLSDSEFLKQDRVMRLLREQRLFQLAPRGLTTAELASRMGISQRSAQRDIVALESELEMPFVKQGNRYEVIKGYFLAPIGFSVPEAMAMLVSARLMARFADRFNPFMEAAYEKIGTVLPASVRAALADATDSLDAARHGAGALILATDLVVDASHRLAEEQLWDALVSDDTSLRDKLVRAGDCVAPRTVHEAVLEGRRAALTVLTRPAAPRSRQSNRLEVAR